MKKTITILEHEDKTSKGGNGKPKTDYTRFKCQFEDQSIKWMSAFDTDLINDLKNHENRPISVEVKEQGDFLNLRKFYGAIAPGMEKLEEALSPGDENEDPELVFLKPENLKVERKSIKGSAYEKDPVGLAVEIFCSSKDANMMDCIDAVKQAQEAFS